MTLRIAEHKHGKSIKQYKRHGYIEFVMHVRVSFEYGDEFTPGEKKLDTQELQSYIAQLTDELLVDEGAYGKNVSEIVDSPNKMHGFVDAAVTAFNEHLGFWLCPQHIQALILEALSLHINANSELLRPVMVNFEGKLRLECRRDGFERAADAKNAWDSCFTDPRDGFLTQIEKNIKSNADSAKFVVDYTSMSPHDKNGLSTMVMSALQAYFEYVITSKCGFAFIMMDGSLDDWKLLKENTAKLLDERALPDFASEWKHALLPILDKFVLEYQNALDGKFGDKDWWNRMILMTGRGGSIGPPQRISGWINNFFPYDKSGERNEHMDKYQASESGLRLERWTSGIVTTPAVWEYYKSSFPLEIKSGFFGMTQIADDYSLKPNLGWCIKYKNEHDYP